MHVGESYLQPPLKYGIFAWGNCLYGDFKEALSHGLFQQGIIISCGLIHEPEIHCAACSTNLGAFLAKSRIQTGLAKLQ